jgi:hypothetical protein
MYYWRPLFVQASQDKAAAMARKSLEWGEEREFELEKYHALLEKPNQQLPDGETNTVMQASKCLTLSTAKEKRAFLDALLPAIESSFVAVVKGKAPVPQPWQRRTLKGITEGRARDIKKYDDETSSESDENEQEVCIH